MKFLRKPATFAAIAGCMGALMVTAAPAEVTVGVVLSMTGPGSAVGVPTRKVLEQVPKEIGGQPLKIIVHDDRSDPSAGTAIARRMAIDEKADVLIGSSLVPGNIAVAAVAKETETVHLTLAPTVLNVQENPWSFNLPPQTTLMASAVFDHMKNHGIKKVGYIGFSDSWGEQWLTELKKYASAGSIEIAGEERFSRGDSSVMGQVLKLLTQKPDAVLVGATSTAAGLVQKTLKEQKFSGPIYHTHGATTPDFVRIAGATGEGAIAPAGPSTVAEELPASNMTKAAGVQFVTAYEEKNGAHTRTPFSAHLNDGFLVLQAAIPTALKSADPGTKAFALALKEAIEDLKELPASQGVYNYSAADHDGLDERARVLVVVKDGAWRYLPE